MTSSSSSLPRGEWPRSNWEWTERGSSGIQITLHKDFELVVRVLAARPAYLAARRPVLHLVREPKR